MTTKELIKKLNQFPSDSNIQFAIYDRDYTIGFPAAYGRIINASYLGSNDRQITTNPIDLGPRIHICLNRKYSGPDCDHNDTFRFPKIIWVKDK